MAVRHELRADAARNRLLILDAGREHLVEHGLPIPMNAVAEAAGVGVGTAYRHFPTQADLVHAIAERAFTELVEHARTAAVAADPARGLRTLLEQAVRALSDPALAAALAGQPQARDVVLTGPARELQELTETVLDRARMCGAVRVDVTADDVRRLVCGIEHAVRIGDPGSADVYVDVLVAGLRP